MKRDVRRSRKFTQLLTPLIIGCLASSLIAYGAGNEGQPDNQVSTRLGGQGSGGTVNGTWASQASSAITGIFNHGPAQNYDYIRAVANQASHQANQLSLQVSQLQQSFQQARSASLAHVPDMSGTGFDDLFNQYLSEIESSAPDPRIDLNSIPNPPDSALPYTIQTHDQLGDELKTLYKNLYKVTPYYENRKEAKEFGLVAVQEADQSYVSGNFEDGNFYKELAQGFLDVAVGLDPVTGFGRSAYELFTGKNLVTGATLSNFERSLAFVGVVTAGNSKFITQAGQGMWRIYQRASHLLHERQAIELAIREGEVLVKRGGRVLEGWRKSHRITHFESAVEANARLALSEPPYQIGSYLVHFKTVGERRFVRVHVEGFAERPWLVKEGEIRGLTPIQIRDKLNLPQTPTHVTDVIVPTETRMSRGMTNFNEWGYQTLEKLEGQVQCRLEQRLPSDTFRNTRLIGDRLK